MRAEQPLYHARQRLMRKQNEGDANSTDIALRKASPLIRGLLR
jgi:hypothetical protein